MNFLLPFKVKSRHLVFVLGFLAFLLIAMGLAGALGLPFSESTASIVSNVAIMGAIIIFFYNRKLRTEEAKELREAEEKALVVAESDSFDAAAPASPDPEGDKSPENR